MSGNNQSKRAARKRVREARARQRRAFETASGSGLGEPDPDSGGRYLKQPGIRYADEDDIAVQCPKCRHVRPYPVSATVLTPAMRAEFKDEGQAYVSCIECGHNIEVAPRREILDDGTMLLWIDRTVLADYEPDEVWIMVMEDQRTGEKFTITQTAADDVDTWVMCQECRQPFVTHRLVAFTTQAGARFRPHGEDIRIGPCTQCGGTGGMPVLTKSTHEGLVTYSNSPGFAESIAYTIAEDIASGEIDLAVAIRRLRQSGDPGLQRIADWIEARPVSAMVVATVLQVAAGLVGPTLTSGDPPPAPVPTTRDDRYSQTQVDQIIEGIIDHYDQQLEDEPRPRRSVGGTQRP